ncbi:hypothetical protein [Nonomuraea sp. NPDC001023]|uniref:hypothetical protein n=1 Tax=unclassified Nonomuraea TaxID=2593643 RepID=UPI003316C2A8
MSDDKPELGYGAGQGRRGHPDDAEASAQELARYSDDLRKAGYRVEPDADDDQALLARESS